MRNITIFCAGILALSLLAAPAKADPANNTSNTLFIVFDLGGFSGNGTNGFSYDSTANLLILNLASTSTSTGLLDFALSFNDFDLGEFDLTGVSYFILGHVTGSEHLILSADGEGAPLDDTFEESLEDGVRNMDQLDGALGDPGGMALVDPNDFADQFGGFGIEGFVDPNDDIPFDTVGTVGGETDLLGFSDPTFLGILSTNIVNGQFVVSFRVPEPGLGLLAVLGLAGAAIARRRRRRNAA